MIMLSLYAVHLLYLSKNSFTFPHQLIPNDKVCAPSASPTVHTTSGATLHVIAPVRNPTTEMCARTLV